MGSVGPATWIFVRGFGLRHDRVERLFHRAYHDDTLVTDEVVGARYRCVACHAPQTDAAPLVKNSFDQ